MFTIKSTSDEGVYYLVNHWDRHKTFWVEPENIKPEMLFKTPADARRSLKKLLTVMDDYKKDTFELVEMDVLKQTSNNIVELCNQQSTKNELVTNQTKEFHLSDADERINIWFNSLLESSGKTSIGELSLEELSEEIAEVKGTISNERLWAHADSIHEENISILTKYLDELITLSDKAKEQRSSLDSVIHTCEETNKTERRRENRIEKDTNITR